MASLTPLFPPIFPPIRELCLWFNSYPLTQLPLFRKFHNFSHPLTIKIGSQSFLFNTVCQWNNHIRCATLPSLLTDVPSSGNAGTTAILTRFSWFSPVPPGKCWDRISIRQKPLPSKSFLTHYSPVILSSDTA
jgi:hypothetical protein